MRKQQEGNKNSQKEVNKIDNFTKENNSKSPSISNKKHKTPKKLKINTNQNQHQISSIEKHNNDKSIIEDVEFSTDSFDENLKNCDFELSETEEVQEKRVEKIKKEINNTDIYKRRDNRRTNYGAGLFTQFCSTPTNDDPESAVKSQDYIDPNHPDFLVKAYRSLKKEGRLRGMKDIKYIREVLLKTLIIQKFIKDKINANYIEIMLFNMALEIVVKKFHKGQKVFNQGDAPKNFYIILKGKVDVLKLGGNEDKQIKKMSFKNYFKEIVDLYRKGENLKLSKIIDENSKIFPIRIEDIKQLSKDLLKYRLKNISIISSNEIRQIYIECGIKIKEKDEKFFNLLDRLKNEQNGNNAETNTEIILSSTKLQAKITHRNSILDKSLNRKKSILDTLNDSKKFQLSALSKGSSTSLHDFRESPQNKINTKSSVKEILCVDTPNNNTEKKEQAYTVFLSKVQESKNEFKDNSQRSSDCDEEKEDKNQITKRQNAVLNKLNIKIDSEEENNFTLEKKEKLGRNYLEIKDNFNSDNNKQENTTSKEDKDKKNKIHKEDNTNSTKLTVKSPSQFHYRLSVLNPYLPKEILGNKSFLENKKASILVTNIITTNKDLDYNFNKYHELRSASILKKNFSYKKNFQEVVEVAEMEVDKNNNDDSFEKLNDEFYRLLNDNENEYDTKLRMLFNKKYENLFYSKNKTVKEVHYSRKPAIDIFKIDVDKEENLVFYDYMFILSLKEGLFFGDFALDGTAGGSRTATIISSDETLLMIIDSVVYNEFIKKEKSKMTEKEIKFLIENFFFKSVPKHKFSSTYYSNFQIVDMYKGDSLYKFDGNFSNLYDNHQSKENSDYFVYFLKEGEVELSFNASLYEIDFIISYLEEILLLYKKTYSSQIIASIQNLVYTINSSSNYKDKSHIEYEKLINNSVYSQEKQLLNKVLNLIISNKEEYTENSEKKKFKDYFNIIRSDIEKGTIKKRRKIIEKLKLRNNYLLSKIEDLKYELLGGYECFFDFKNFINYKIVSGKAKLYKISKNFLNKIFSNGNEDVKNDFRRMCFTQLVCLFERLNSIFKLNSEKLIEENKISSAGVIKEVAYENSLKLNNYRNNERNLNEKKYNFTSVVLEKSYDPTVLSEPTFKQNIISKEVEETMRYTYGLELKKYESSFSKNAMQYDNENYNNIKIENEENELNNKKIVENKENSRKNENLLRTNSVKQEKYSVNKKILDSKIIYQKYEEVNKENKNNNSLKFSNPENFILDFELIDATNDSKPNKEKQKKVYFSNDGGNELSTSILETVNIDKNISSKNLKIKKSKKNNNKKELVKDKLDKVINKIKKDNEIIYFMQLLSKDQNQINKFSETNNDSFVFYSKTTNKSQLKNYSNAIIKKENDNLNIDNNILHTTSKTTKKDLKLDLQLINSSISLDNLKESFTNNTVRTEEEIIRYNPNNHPFFSGVTDYNELNKLIKNSESPKFLLQTHLKKMFTNNNEGIQNTDDVYLPYSIRSKINTYIKNKQLGFLENTYYSNINSNKSWQSTFSKYNKFANKAKSKILYSLDNNDLAKEVKFFNSIGKHHHNKFRNLSTNIPIVNSIDSNKNISTHYSTSTSKLVALKEEIIGNKIKK